MDFQIVVPPLPGKALKRQLPFRSDDGIFEEEFIEDRRKGEAAFQSYNLLFIIIDLPAKSFTVIYCAPFIVISKQIIFV